MFDDVHLSVMLATFAIFIAMVVILNSTLYKPLLQFMSERASSISNDERKVQENFDEVSNFKVDLEKIYQETKNEISRIKQEAINEARTRADEELKKKKEELEQGMDAFYASLDKERKDLEKELKIHLPQWQQLLQKNLSRI